VLVTKWKDKIVSVLSRKGNAEQESPLSCGAVDTLNLALVTETFPPEVNGVSMTLGKLVDGLRERGHHTTVVAPRRPDRESLEGRHNLVMVPGVPIPRYRELRFGLPAHRRLLNLWKQNRPDLIHVATEGPLGWSALRIADKLGIPVVSSFHTNFHSYGRHYGFGFLHAGVLKWLRHCHNRTLRTFAPSNDLIETLKSDGFHNLRLLARGVDTDLFGPHRRSDDLRNEWKSGPDVPVALYVGRLAGEKNLSLVIEAYNTMREGLNDLRLVLVGDGPERKRIQKEAPEAVFAGMRQGVSLAQHYASADAFIFASVTETFGNVVTEAMASSLPVLAFDYAAPGRFIKNGSNGFLAPFDDRASFLEQAREMATRRNEWGSLGRKARESIFPHSWDSVIDSYLRELMPLTDSSK